MAKKKIYSPITQICDRYNAYKREKFDGKPSDYVFSLDDWKQSFILFPCDSNRYILEAIEKKDKEEMYFAMEHLIHQRCDGVRYSKMLIDFIREVDWMWD